MIYIEVHTIKSIKLIDIEPLLIESTREGIRFIKRMIDEYDLGINRFDKPGEALFVVKNDLGIVGIGGLNQDPYIQEDGYGRVRHLYVLEKHRGNGIGKAILKRIIDEAREHFSVLLLRTNNEIADGMYCKEGFIKSNRYSEASHYFTLQK